MQMYSLQEFDDDQKAEIQAGIDVGLDVQCYAKPAYLAIQMRQVRLGLQDGLDVSVYNSPQYDWFQMEEIRLGMLEGINYALYAKPELDYQRMRQLRMGLQDGIDMSLFAQLEPGILKELRKAVAARISIVDYIREGYQVDQLEEIREALEMKLDIKPYICVEQMGASIREIRLGLEKRLPVHIYADMEYSWQQMREIRLGLEAGLDVEEYRNSLYSWQQMREIRLGLDAGIDVSAYKSFIYTANEMEKIRSKMVLEEAKGLLGGVTKEWEDEYVTVFISRDEMEACIELNCDKDVTLTVQDVIDRLKGHGVSQGILKEEIEAVLKEKRYHQTVVIAKGKEAQKGEDGYYEFFFNTNPSREPRILEDGTADFRAIKWYEMVEMGQRIALYHNATYGKPGYTVTGKFLKAKRGKEKSALSGKNIEVQPDKKTYIATMAGKIDMVGESRIDISRVCVYEEVNLATGDVNFDGSIYVNGNVSRGSVIFATENIVIAGFVEGAIIKCGGDICLRKGMNGAGIGRIETIGNVMGQFFEATRVVAGGDVSAHYCLNCDIRAEGKLTIYGEKGLLAGGFARGARGITAYTVGNRAHINTVLNAGVDSRFLNGIRQLEGKIEGVNRELLILNNSYIDFQNKYSPEVRNTMDLYLKIENAIYTKNLQHKELTEKREELEQMMQEMTGAKVVVEGVLHEGTEVIIDDVKWKAFEVCAVSVRCRNGKIIVESK